VALLPSIIEIVPMLTNIGSRHHVVVLAYDRLALFEFSMAVEVFGQHRPEAGDGWYRFSSASIDRAPVRATGGIVVETGGGMELLAQADTIVIPGWDLGRNHHPVHDVLVKAQARGTRLVSICTGSFLLASAGLLDGRRATTHWRHMERFSADYPAVELVPDVLYVEEDNILTSAGSAAGIDLCLHVVRRDFGAAVANMVARRMVVGAHRDGGQRQFVERPLPRDHEAGRFGRLLAELRARPEAPCSLADMARRAGMSRRTLVRRFKEATGQPPGEWLLTERIGRARDLLETSDAALEEIARISGFGTAAALRHHFSRLLGVTPTRYRRQFGYREA
jgi:AraC family transcriptional activator FtrA